MRSFIFGEGQEAKTPAQLARMRELADAMVAANGRAPQNVGEGLQSIGNAILYRSLMGKVGAGEKAGQNRASAAFNNIAGALAGPKAFPAAPTGGTASAPQSADAQAIRSGLIERGLPEHVADGFLMNFQDESGMNPGINEKAPLVPGSRGGFGLYQLTGPRRTAYEAFAGQRGVDPSDTNAQLDFLMTELQGPEAKAAQSIMATKDAGSAASAIARDFLRPAKEHLDSRVARYMGGNPAPVQVASADPSDGIAQALAQQQSPQPQGNQQIAQALAQQQNQPQVQDLSQVPVMAGGTGGAITRDAQGGPSLQMLMETANEPFLNDSQRGILDALMQQQMQNSDPMRQLQIQKLQQDLNAKPERKTVTINGRLVDAQTGQEIANFPEEAKKPSAVQEYEYAKTQGFPGTFQDWEASKKGGMSLTVDPATGQVSFQQGNNIKPMTEGQSKDTTFAVRAEGALPLIDKYGDALTSLPESAAGSLPGGVGNYLQSPEYQQAQQAGKEWLQAILRKDTGAAITKEETEEYGSVYLPRPGDSPDVLAQKKASRTRALEALKAGMTPQAILAQEKALEKTNAPAAAPSDGIARPTTEEEYNALPSGSTFIDPEDGKQYRKP